MAVDRDHHFFHGHVQLLGRGFNNADIGLMRHQPVDLVRVDMIVRQNLPHDIGLIFHGVFENLAAFHLDMARRLRRRWAAIGIKQFAPFTVRI